MLERHCPKGARDRSGGSVQATRLNKLPGSHVLLKGTSSDIICWKIFGSRWGPRRKYTQLPHAVAPPAAVAVHVVPLVLAARVRKAGVN